MSRRIVIEIDVAADESGKPRIVFSAKAMDDAEMVAQHGYFYDDLASAFYPGVGAAAGKINNLLEDRAPNGKFCHDPATCWLTGRCEKQFGPTGTACCE